MIELCDFCGCCSDFVLSDGYYICNKCFNVRFFNDLKEVALCYE